MIMASWLWKKGRLRCFLLAEEITILRFWRNEMRKCIRCDRDMLEDYDVKVEGGVYG